MSTREAVICEPVRTPIGRYGGMFKSQTAVDLGVAALTGLLDRTGVPPESVQDVILGHCYPSSEAPAIGRVVALDAGLPVTVPGMQVDRRCGSGLQAVIQACLQVSAGDNDLVVAGGAESMSNVAAYSTPICAGAVPVAVCGCTTGWPADAAPPVAVTTRCPAGCWKPRKTCDGSTASRGKSRTNSRWLRTSGRWPRRRMASWPKKSFRSRVRSRCGEELIDNSTSTRATDTTVESLSKLKPVLLEHDPEATVTAGNASGQNDAASMCLVTTPEKAGELGLTPLVRLVSWGVAAVPPDVMGIGPVPATEVALAKAGLQMSDIDLFELNEAFAAQALARSCGSGTLASTIGSGRTCTARVYRWVIRSARPAVGCWPRWPASSIGGTRALRELETMCIGGGQGLRRGLRTSRACNDPAVGRLSPSSKYPASSRRRCAA